MLTYFHRSSEERVGLERRATSSPFLFLSSAAAVKNTGRLREN